MENVSPTGRSVREEMTEQARLDPELRAELERLRPFEEVARQIIRVRLDQGLSQEALAERVGTTKSAISRLESGQHAPNLATLDKIAAAFGGRLEVAFHVPEAATPRHALTAV
jgi:ribosome-binding protein aMBF1 (putative translation factor)